MLAVLLFMRIYIIRHGEPDYEKDSLTEDGIKEALALSKYLSTIKLDFLFTSPIPRARETSSYTEKLLGLEAKILPWTEEVKLNAPDGSDFMPYYMNPENFREESYLNNDSWQSTFKKIINESDSLIESFGWKRNGHQYRYLSHKKHPKNIQIAFFCHGGFGLTYLSHLLQIPCHMVWSSFFLHTSSITTVLFDERPKSIATPRVIGLSALPHLYKNELQPSTTGIKSNYL
jgi:broad specificity phosphatase PhoE